MTFIFFRGVCPMYNHQPVFTILHSPFRHKNLAPKRAESTVILHGHMFHKFWAGNSGKGGVHQASLWCTSGHTADLPRRKCSLFLLGRYNFQLALGKFQHAQNCYPPVISHDYGKSQVFMEHPLYMAIFNSHVSHYHVG